jgi:hypothetical protein
MNPAIGGGRIMNSIFHQLLLEKIRSCQRSSEHSLDRQRDANPQCVIVRRENSEKSSIVSLSGLTRSISQECKCKSLILRRQRAHPMNANRQIYIANRGQVAGISDKEKRPTDNLLSNGLCRDRYCIRCSPRALGWRMETIGT